jgi:hypothetical protein
VATAAGVPFPDLFRGWTIALAQAGRQRFDEDETPPGQFRSLDLSGRLGRWSLQGIRAVESDLAEAPQSFSLQGTTAKIFEVRAPTPGVYRLRVRTKGLPQLQVTVIRLVDEGPELTATADWQPSTSLPASNTQAIKVRIESSGASPVKVLRMAVESAQGKLSQSHCWEASLLPASQIVEGEDPKIQELLLDPPARMFSSSRKTPGKWMLKILAEDQQGRRTATWIELPAPPATQPIPLAAQPGRAVF